MKKQLNNLKEFHGKIYKDTNITPVNLSEKEIVLRYNLMQEENKEYLEACKNENLVEIADALGDMLYVLLGTIERHGMSDIIEDVFGEIHQSNLSKFDENGNPIFREDGKLLKSNKYFKPNLKPIVLK